MRKLYRLIKEFMQTFLYYFRDCMYYLHHTPSSFNTSDSQPNILGQIALRSHVIEKGITMPNRHYNFGEENVRELINLCKKYSECNFDKGTLEFTTAISVLMEYKKIHEENRVSLPTSISNEIIQLSKTNPNIVLKPQKSIKKEEMYQHGDFKYIAQHRHSVRNFCGEVNLDVLCKAIELAQTAPTACNRQSIYTYCIKDEDKKKHILELQKGNRGFGQYADKVLVVAAKLDSYHGAAERNLMYVDGGIYTMNLLYSLQYYGISACTLSATLLPFDTNKILGIDGVIISLIAIGDCPEEFLVPRSDRKKAEINFI